MACCWVILFLYRVTLMVTLTLVCSWALRPSPQKLPAPPQPHTSQRSVNRQTPPWIRWSVWVLQKLLLFFLSFYFFAPSAIERGISMIGLHLFCLSLLALCFCVCVWRYHAPPTSDGERRNFRNKNREKDRHLRRCRHRSRSGLFQLLCSFSISPHSCMWFQKVDLSIEHENT